MAARDKKLKNLQSDQQTALPAGEQASDSKNRVTDVAPNSSSGAEGDAKKNGSVKVGRPKNLKKIKKNAKQKAMPGTSTDVAVKTVARRGRPPGSTNRPKLEVESEEVATDEPTAKPRGRKRTSINDSTEKTPEADATKLNVAKEGDGKKTAMKGLVTKKVAKKKLFVTKRGVAKKKVLLSKKTLKGIQAKQVDPKILKKNLTAKLKSASEKIDTKKDSPETPTAEKMDTETTTAIPDLKTEIEAPDNPTSVSSSRSSSPKTCKRPRTSSDVSITKNDSGTKSPYSMRSERSSPQMLEPAQKPLRNGRQRKVKNALLAETVDQEFKKRRRLVSDSRDSKSSDVGSDIDDIKKVKRLRSYSRDGSEISKCSDTTDFDLSFNDTVDPDKPELKDVSKVQEDIKSNGELDLMEESVSDKAVMKSEDKSDSVEDSEAKTNSIDNENNNTNDKSKTESVVCSEKSAGSEATSPVTEANKGPETLSDKSLILDNMSKTFNESALSEKAKSIRRSARQRKITVKAKEHEEAVLAEKDAIEAELRLLKSIKVEPEDNCNKSPKSIKKEDASPTSADPSKLAPKKILQDSENNDIVNNASDENELKSKSSCEELEKTTDSDENLKLLFEEDEETDSSQVATDDSHKENIHKLMFKLKTFEEQDKKRQEEKAAEKHVMVTSDVVLISKSNSEHKPLKDIPNMIKADKPSEKDVLSCFEHNSAISIVKKDQVRKSIDIDSPSITITKKTGPSRKHSTSSNDAVTLIDKSGKEVSLEIRKSIEKVLTPTDAKLTNLNSEAVTISIKQQPPKEVVAKPDSQAIAKSAKLTETPKEVIADKVEEIVTPVVALGTVSTESPEKQRQKEMVLRHLGLLTHEAAKKAKLEKLKQKEMYAKQASKHPNKVVDSGYTGTLKTIIKLNKTPDKKKGRSPLKLTFQKSKGRGSKVVSDSISGSDESDENPHYVIHKESGGSSGAGSLDGQSLSGGHRKTHYSNRFNNDLGLHDSQGDLSDPNSGKEATPNLVIPEKASSFSIHPDRLCQDQCFYCGGKFGLFDTPCHIAQIKSRERQKKILDSEEKLSVDSCLCDACYRHVDRRANCPSYRKRAGPAALLMPQPQPGNTRDTCHVTNCTKLAPQSLRRKWLVKMKKSIAKVVNINLDYLGLHTIPLCEEHYETISLLMVCGLCKKRLSKNHVHFINQEYQSLNPLLKEQGVPVEFTEKPIVCKACRVFCTLLLRPSESDKRSNNFFSSQRRRLLQCHNISVPEESDKETNQEEEVISAAFIKDHDPIKDKKKSKNGKNKTKKGSDSGKSTDENNSSIILNLNKEKGSDEWKNKNIQNKSMGMEEDIESLISSNKILVPSGNNTPKTGQNKIDDSEGMVVEYDNPLISALDNKQYQYLLQKCSIKPQGPNKKVNLTQKSKNILKVQNSSTITKPATNQKILDKNAKRIQKLGQIITQRTEPEQATDGSDTAIDKLLGKDLSGLNIIKNIQLNDECTIETIAPKNSKPVDTNSMKMKWQLSNSYTQIKKNLSALSKNVTDEHGKKKTTESNPVRRLETNPSISVRELFPGEEEMNLQCSIEFGNVKSVTPEGWEKCNSIIQYDTVTKKLWHDLQKPYGNQSSFLRHLILLEKYFRNGDLVLSPNANHHAVTYSESVQNRLRAYDNIATINGNVAANGLSAFLKNSSVTLVPHVPSPPPMALSSVIPEISSETPKKPESTSLIEFRKQKPNSGKSLLKANQHSDGNKMFHAKFPPKCTSMELLPPPPPPIVNQAKIPKNVPISIAQINQSVDQAINVAKIPKNMPLSLTQLEKMGNQLPPLPVAATNPRPSTPRPDSKSMQNDFVKPQPMASSSDHKMNQHRPESSKSKMSLPPELIAINPQITTQRKSIENVLKNIQQLAKNSMASPAPPPMPSTSLQSPGFSPIALGGINVTLTSKQPEVSTITTTSAPIASTPIKKSKGSGKQWRPTLIPITDESKSKNARDVLYQTADGRRLPSLVQVMSGGKPYHITIQDYNKMCVMRREKLLHMQKSDKKKSSSSSSTSQSNSAKDSLPSITIMAQISDKPPSPDAVLAPGENQQVPLNIDDVKIPSAVTITPKLSEADAIIETDPTSILKSAGLKNVTIAAITTAEETKPSSPVVSVTDSNKTALVPVSSMQLIPATISMESPLKAMSSLAAIAPKSLAITPQPVIMPKIPKSLTVIPQSSIAQSVASPPISLSSSVAITTVATISSAPPQLIPVSASPPQTEP